jgi:hypothetical protein
VPDNNNYSGELSEGFLQSLLSWVHPGFPVFAEPQVEASEIASLKAKIIERIICF